MSIFTSSFSSFSRKLFLATSGLVLASNLFLNVPAQANLDSTIQATFDVIYAQENLNSQKFSFDVPNSNYNSGTRIIIWPSHGGPNQAFSFTGFKPSPVLPVESVGEIKVSGKCLDAFGGVQTGAAIGIWDCHGGANQNWTFKIENPVESASSGYLAKYTIRPTGSPNYCLDAAGSLTAGTQLILWPCHGGTNQMWKGDVKVYTTHTTIMGQ